MRKVLFLLLKFGTNLFLVSFISHAKKVRGSYEAEAWVLLLRAEMGDFPDWSGLHDVPGTMEPVYHRPSSQARERRQVQGWSWEWLHPVTSVTAPLPLCIFLKFFKINGVNVGPGRARGGEGEWERIPAVLKYNI